MSQIVPGDSSPGTPVRQRCAGGAVTHEDFILESYWSGITLDFILKLLN
jgi:hypothetical protein